MVKIVNDLVYTCLLPAQEDHQESIHLDGRWSAILKTAIWHTPWDGSASLYLDSWVQVLRIGFTTYNTGQCWECKRRLTSSWVIMSRFLSKTTFCSVLMLSANFSKVWKLQRWIMAKMNIYAVPPTPPFPAQSGSTDDSHLYWVNFLGVEANRAGSTMQNSCTAPENLAL